MRPMTTENIFEILDGYFTSAALGAAMELGLLWLLVAWLRFVRRDIRLSGEGSWRLPFLSKRRKTA